MRTPHDLTIRTNEIEDMLSNIELSYTTNLMVDIIKIRAKNIDTGEVVEEAMAYHDVLMCEDEELDNIIRKLVKKAGGKVKC